MDGNPFIFQGAASPVSAHDARPATRTGSINFDGISERTRRWCGGRRAGRRRRLRSGLPVRNRLVSVRLSPPRPPEVEGPGRLGDWEGDLIIGRGGHSAIGALVERRTGLLRLIAPPDGRSPERLCTAIAPWSNCSRCWSMGVHLRWSSPRQGGLPWHAYLLFRRPHDNRGERRPSRSSGGPAGTSRVWRASQPSSAPCPSTGVQPPKRPAAVEHLGGGRPGVVRAPDRQSRRGRRS